MASLQDLYRPLRLEIGEIRLLKVHPSPEFSSQLQCSLFKADPAKKEAYHALSYVWGKGHSSTALLINNIPFVPTQNLFNALRHLRRPEKDFVIWIDAICIDQSSVQERSEQVQRMRDIFRDASDVIVWLGGPENDAEYAIDFIKEIARECPRLEEIRHQNELEPFFRSLEAITTRQWDALDDIISRPYWTRMWVYQEFLVARKTILVAGSNSSNGITFLEAFMYLKRMQHYEEESDFSIDRLAGTSFDGLQTFFNHYTQFELLHPGETSANEANKYDLQLLLFHTAHLECIDPRDKIFALLGMNQVGAPSIEIDYSHSVANIYTSLIKYTASNGSLTFVGCSGVGIPQTSPSLNLPSWVPDLRPNTHRSIYLDFRRMGGEVTQLTMFSASGSLGSQAAVDDNLKVLHADGIVVATASKLSTAAGDFAEGEEINQWRDSALSNRDHDMHPAGIPMWQAFFRTLIADSSGHIIESWPENLESHEFGWFYELAVGFMICGVIESSHSVEFNRLRIGQERDATDACHFLADYAIAFSLLRGGIPGPTNTTAQILEPFTGNESNNFSWPKKEPTYSGMPYWKKFLWRRYAICSEKRFFVTSNGYFGLGPPGMQEGDRICVLLGCDIPIAIRAVQDHFCVVGGCYVYGMMKGEVIQRMQVGELQLETLTFQ